MLPLELWPATDQVTEYPWGNCSILPKTSKNNLMGPAVLVSSTEPEPALPSCGFVCMRVNLRTHLPLVRWRCLPVEFLLFWSFSTSSLLEVVHRMVQCWLEGIWVQPPVSGGAGSPARCCSSQTRSCKLYNHNEWRTSTCPRFFHSHAQHERGERFRRGQWCHVDMAFEHFGTRARLKKSEQAGTEDPDYGDAMGIDSLPGGSYRATNMGRKPGSPRVLTLWKPGPKMIAHRIGPDLGRVEGFSSTVGNLKAGLGAATWVQGNTADGEADQGVVGRVLGFCLHTWEHWTVADWQPYAHGRKKLVCVAFPDRVLRGTWWRASQAFSMAFKWSPTRYFPRRARQGSTADNHVRRSWHSYDEPRGQLYGRYHVQDVLHKAQTERRRHARLPWNDYANVGDCDTIEGDGSAWDSCCTPEFRDHHGKSVFAILHPLASWTPIWWSSSSRSSSHCCEC